MPTAGRSVCAICEANRWCSTSGPRGATPATPKCRCSWTLEKQYAARGVRFIAASLDDAKTPAGIPAFLAEYKIAFPVWYGATGDDLGQLKLGGAVPATAFLDAEGRVMARILGQARPEEVKQPLDWLTGGKSAPAPEPVVKHLQ
jgi:hypothetical protein